MCVHVRVCSCACVIAGSTLTADVLPNESVSATLLMSANLPGSSAPILERRTEVEKRKGMDLNLQMESKFCVVVRKMGSCGVKEREEGS